MAVRSTPCVEDVEALPLGVVARALIVGKIDRPFELERFGIHVRATASGALNPRAILLVRQRGNIAAKGFLQAQSILLPALVFRAPLEWLIEITESFVRIEIDSHGAKVGVLRVDTVARTLRRGKHKRARPSIFDRTPGTGLDCWWQTKARRKGTLPNNERFRETVSVG